MNAGALLAVAFVVLSPGTHNPVSAAAASPAPVAASPASDPAPSVSIATTSPALTQESPLVWTTKVVIDESPSCLAGLKYQLITTSPDFLVNGMVRGMAAVEPVAGASGVSLSPDTLVPVKPPNVRLASGCGQRAGGEAEVSLAFRLPEQFTTPPLSATLVVDDPGGTAPPATAQLTVQRLVTSWDYVWVPLICGTALALLLLIGVGVVPFYGTVRRLLAREGLDHSGNGFWRRPIYASGAWSFTDSWATNISAAGTIIAGTITAATGTVTVTLLPGVPLDRFAVLIAICGAIIVAAPLAFGLLNTLCTRSRPTVPANATMRFPSGQAEILAPAGASLTFAGGATTADQDGGEVALKAGAAVPVPAGAGILADLSDNGVAIFPGDSTILLKGAGTVRITTDRNEEFTVPAGAVQSAPAADAPATTRWTTPKAINLTAPGGDGAPPAPSGDGVTVRAVGSVTARVPKDTTVRAPGLARVKTFRRETSLRVPVDDGMIAADMRSLLPAGMITLFGIGAELGLLSVLAGGLSAAPGMVHAIAVAVAAVMAVVVLGYSIVTTMSLFGPEPGSALAPNSKTSATL